MKNSARYARKIKKLLSGAQSTDTGDEADLARLLVKAVLEENATHKQAAKGLAALEEEFIDLNELRVSPIKDIVECLGRGFPDARAKAESMTGALNAVFERQNALSLQYLETMPKRDVRKTLRESLHLSPYAESVLTLRGYDGHAVPVDRLLLEALKLDSCIHPDSDLGDLQGFLERIILNKDARAAHEALRAYASKAAGRVVKELARRARLAEKAARAAAAAEAKAKAEAEAKAKAKAEAAAKRAAAKKAAARQAARKRRRPPAKRAARGAKTKTKKKAKSRALAGKGSSRRAKK